MLHHWRNNSRNRTVQRSWCTDYGDFRVAGFSPIVNNGKWQFDRVVVVVGVDGLRAESDLHLREGIPRLRRVFLRQWRLAIVLHPQELRIQFARELRYHPFEKFLALASIIPIVDTIDRGSIFQNGETWDEAVDNDRSQLAEPNVFETFSIDGELGLGGSGGDLGSVTFEVHNLLWNYI